MTSETNSQPTSDEKMMGALAHFFGMLGALIVWMLQKDKSRFVRYQAAQALLFDFIVMALMIVVFTCLFGIMFLGMIGTFSLTMNSNSSPQSFNSLMALPFLFPTFMFTCIYPFSLIFSMTRLIAAISVLSGKNFHYPILGERVEKFLLD